MTIKEHLRPSNIGSRRSLIKNSSGIFLGRILASSISLIAVPIVVSKLGVIGFGTWESILAVSVISNIFQGTVSGTALWKISSAYGADDMESVRQYVGMGIFFSLLLFFTVTPLVYFGRDIVIHLFQVPEQYRSSASIILPCVTGLMVLGSINEIMSALIGGFQRAGTAMLIQAFSTILNSLAIIFFLWMGFEFWSLLIGFGIGFVTYGAGLYIISNRIFSSFSLIPLIPVKAALRGVTLYSSFMLIGAVSMVLRDQVDKIILSSLASPLWTGYYGIATRLASLLLMVCTFIYIPTIAAAGAMESRGDWTGVQRLYTDVMTVMALVVGWFIALVAGLHDRLLILWLGKPISEAGIILYILIAGNAIAVLLTGVGSSVCKGIGIIRIETIYIVVGLLLNLIFKAILVPWMGAIGTVVSSSGSWALSSVVFIWLLHKQTELPVVGTIRASKALIIGTVCAFFGRWLSSQIPLESTRWSAFFTVAELGIVITLVFITLMLLFRAFPISAVSLAGRMLRTRFANNNPRT